MLARRESGCSFWQSRDTCKLFMYVEVRERGEHRRERGREGGGGGDSLHFIEVTLETSHAERSPLNCSALSNTEDGERRQNEERQRGTGGTHTHTQQKEREGGRGRTHCVP